MRTHYIDKISVEDSLSTERGKHGKIILTAPQPY
jgi:hypothetical protein